MGVHVLGHSEKGRGPGKCIGDGGGVGGISVGPECVLACLQVLDPVKMKGEGEE